MWTWSVDGVYALNRDSDVRVDVAAVLPAAGGQVVEMFDHQFTPEQAKDLIRVLVSAVEQCARVRVGAS